MSYSVTSVFTFKIESTFDEWAEYLNWETTPVFTDEEAGQIVAKLNS